MYQELKQTLCPTVKFRNVQAFLQAKKVQAGQKHKSPEAENNDKAEPQSETEDPQKSMKKRVLARDDDDGVSDCESDGFLVQEYVDLKVPKPALHETLSTAPISVLQKPQARCPVAPSSPVNLTLLDSDWKM